MEEQKLEVTAEQRKEIGKILFKGRVSLLGSAIKFAIGLFGLDLITILVGNAVLKDTDPEMQIGFQTVSIFVNFIFMAVFLHRQVKATTDIVTEKVKAVLKNNNTQ